MESNNTLKWQRTVLFAMMLPYIYVGSSSAYAAMRMLDDQDLSATTGQAAFYTTYVAPNAANTNTNFGFFTLGLNGEVAINANIQHLQLGCGGVNGAAGCDEDISNLSLSGNPGASVPAGMTTSYGGSGTIPFSSSTPRAATDALLENPFLSIAIANPLSLSTRSIAGIQFGAQSILGLLTAGSSNSSASNGITSLSGYMQLAPITYNAALAGTAASTQNSYAATASQAINYAATGNQAIQVANINILGFCGCISATVTSYSLTANSTSGDPLTTNAATINGTRINSAILTGSAQVNPVTFAGTMTAYGALALSVTGTITGLTAAATINENLGYIHDIPLAGQALALSLQNQNILWPGSPAGDVAQTGWWLSTAGAINLGSVTPTNAITLTTGSTTSVIGQIIPPLNNYLSTTTIPCFLGSCALASVTLPNIGLSATTLQVGLTNLTLAAQGIKPNCYGSLKFC